MEEEEGGEDDEGERRGGVFYKPLPKKLQKSPRVLKKCKHALAFSFLHNLSL